MAPLLQIMIPLPLFYRYSKRYTRYFYTKDFYRHSEEYSTTFTVQDTSNTFTDTVKDAHPTHTTF
ncbi:UNVERIFIED_CONTAM: hypothetical protein NCL1_55831 [Trichonephila clavipes]